MWKHTPTNANVRPGKGWTDEEGTQHPGNWHVWSVQEKADRGLVEIIQQPAPDSRFYHWGHNPDGTVTSVEKPLQDIKDHLKNEVLVSQSAMLGATDWVYIRFIDTNKPVPVATKQHRDAIRKAAVDHEVLIDAALTIAALVAVGDIVWPEEII
tara:strand:- start:4510 stop:4971 length:462 start_codon:yes stop_codon:yes gene_type:complete